MITKIVNSPSRFFSPLRYPGGKAVLASYLEHVITNKCRGDVTYVEPYAGGAGAALFLLLTEVVDRVVINDLDTSIYAFWKSVVQVTERFIDCIEKTEITIDEWERQKLVYHNSQSDFEVGFAMFFLNRTNRSGLLNGGPIGGKDQCGTWKIDARFNKAELIRKIARIGRYRSRIDVRNLDGIRLADQSLTDDRCFLYLDPPYVVKGYDLYMNHYSINDHKDLAAILNAHADRTWLLSYDNVELIRQLYSRRVAAELSIKYHADTSKIGSEILVFSDKISRKEPNSDFNLTPGASPVAG